MGGALESGRARPVFHSTDAPALRGRIRLRAVEADLQAAVNVAYLSGGVSHGRGGDVDEWQPASVGQALATGDRLYTSRGACVELRSAAFEIRLSSGTGLEAIDLREGAGRFYVWGGSASFRVRRLRPGESFVVDTPSAGVTFESAGEYRIDLVGTGRTNVVVDGGDAWASAAGLTTPLEPGTPSKQGVADLALQELTTLEPRDSQRPRVVLRAPRPSGPAPASQVPRRT